MLTDTAIRKAKPRKRTKMFDGSGLYLEATPEGGRWWRLKYRFAGKERRISLGVYPEVSLADARAARDEARKQLRDGIDPSLERQAQKAAKVDAAANTFEGIAREWHKKFEATWAASHSKRVLQRLENDVFPYIGARAISELQAPDLLQVLRRVESREAIETAHRIRTICGMVFRYAVATGRAQRDPTADLRGALPPAKREHMAAVTDPRALGNLLRVLSVYDGSPVVGAALKLAPLLFVRPGELRAARWEDIDLDAAEWSFTTSKTEQAHVVPLCKQAVAILKDLQPLTGRGPYVFPNGRSSSRPMSDNAVLAALRSLGVPKEVTSGHGFRATARTLLDEVLGYPAHLIEHQLAHAVKDPLGRAYNRTQHLTERRKMMQAWADYLDKLRADVKVLPFPTREAKAG